MDLHIAHAIFHINGVPADLARVLGADARARAEILTTRAALTPPVVGARWADQGGVYLGSIPPLFGLPGRHLIKGSSETRKRWGPTTDVEHARSHVDGLANTQALVGDDFPAAQWCRDYVEDGHDDYFLGARFELLFGFLNAPQCFTKDGVYWTSTQDSRTSAFVQFFASGDSHWGAKVSEWLVSPFRQIYFSA